jgi:hypothetical protein
MVLYVEIYRNTFIGFRASGTEYLFSVAMAAASGSAIVKISSLGRFPKPAFLAAWRVASFASSDHMAGNVIQHSIGVFSYAEAVICWQSFEDMYMYSSCRKSSHTPSASRKRGNCIIPWPDIFERAGSSYSPATAFLSSKSFVHE